MYCRPAGAQRGARAAGPLHWLSNLHLCNPVLTACIFAALPLLLCRSGGLAVWSSSCWPTVLSINTCYWLSIPTTLQPCPYCLQVRWVGGVELELLALATGARIVPRFQVRSGWEVAHSAAACRRCCRRCRCCSLPRLPNHPTHLALMPTCHLMRPAPWARSAGAQCESVQETSCARRSLPSS